MSIKAVKGRVVIKADKEQKNHYTFSNGLVIRMERDYNNLDRSYTQQIFGEVINSENIPAGSFLLFHFNALIESNKIYNHSKLSGDEIASGVEIYSIPENQCFLWKKEIEQEWQPCDNFATALRVFQPYKGMLQGIEPTKLKDVLYVKTGELSGKVVKTLKACDAVLVFRNEKGIDQTIIRFRPLGDESSEREPEAIAIMDELTRQVNDGELLIGITESDAIPIQITAYAD